MVFKSFFCCLRWLFVVFSFFYCQNKGIKHRSTEHNSSLMMSESELDSDQDTIFSRDRPVRSRNRIGAQANRNGNAFGWGGGGVVRILVTKTQDLSGIFAQLQDEMRLPENLEDQHLCHLCLSDHSDDVMKGTKVRWTQETKTFFVSFTKEKVLDGINDEVEKSHFLIDIYLYFILI